MEIGDVNVVVLKVGKNVGVAVGPQPMVSGSFERVRWDELLADLQRGWRPGKAAVIGEAPAAVRAWCVAQGVPLVALPMPRGTKVELVDAADAVGQLGADLNEAAAVVALHGLLGIPAQASPAEVAPDARPELLTLAQLSQLLQLHRSTIWRLVKRGSFPEPFKPTPGAVRWRRAEVERWVAAAAG